MGKNYLIKLYFFIGFMAGICSVTAGSWFGQNSSSLVTAFKLSISGPVGATQSQSYSLSSIPLRELSYQIPSSGMGFVPTPFPTVMVSPPPAPTQNPSSLIDRFFAQDTRSWTKFSYKNLIAQTAVKYDLDPQLIYATIMTESEGDIFAYRYERHLREASLCMGQILVSTARGLGFTGSPSGLFEPSVCIDLVGKYHRNMLDTFGDLTPLQLATAYNAGSPWKRPVRGHLIRFKKWFEETG